MFNTEGLLENHLNLRVPIGWLNHNHAAVMIYQCSLGYQTVLFWYIYENGKCNLNFAESLLVSVLRRKPNNQLRDSIR